MRIGHAVLSLGLLLALPAVVAGQEAEKVIAKGDSVRFSVQTDPGPTTWTGVVREVVNPRDCVFVLVRSYEGSNVFSIALKMHDGFVLERLAPVASDFSAAVLKSQGIQCIEAHRLELPRYLNPLEESDSEAGA